MKYLARDLLKTFILCIIGVTVHGSFKKGICVSPNAFLCDDLNVLDNVEWWYNWGPNLDVVRQRSQCLNVNQHIDQHVPMAWGYGRYFQNYYLYDQAEYLLGFNEPNHQGQSNILPEDAARYWPEVEILAAGRPLVSPAAAPCTAEEKCNGNTKEWFDQFFNNCTGCRVDYLATHVYKCNVNKTMAFLEDLYKTYNMKIWLTEFACPYKTNPDRQLRYMAEILPRLEDADYIFRYAWYVSRVTEGTATTFIPTSVSLFEPTSSNLTTLGKFYNSFTSAKTTSARTTWSSTQSKSTSSKTTFTKSTATKTISASTGMTTASSSTTTSTVSVTTTDPTRPNTTVISTLYTTTRKYNGTDGITIISSAIRMTPYHILIMNIFISAFMIM